MPNNRDANPKTEYMGALPGAEKVPAAAAIPSEPRERLEDLLRSGPMVEIQRLNLLSAITALKNIDDRSLRLLLSCLEPKKNDENMKIVEGEEYPFMLAMLKVCRGDMQDVSASLATLLQGTPEKDRPKAYRDFCYLIRLLGKGINVLSPQTDAEGFRLSENEELAIWLVGDNKTPSEKFYIHWQPDGVLVYFKRNTAKLQRGQRMLFGREFKASKLFGCKLDPPLTIVPPIKVVDKEFSGIGLIFELDESGMLRVKDNMNKQNIHFETSTIIGHYERKCIIGSDGQRDIGLSETHAKAPKPLAQINSHPDVDPEHQQMPLAKPPPSQVAVNVQPVVAFNRLADALEPPPIPEDQKPKTTGGWIARTLIAIKERLLGGKKKD